MQNSNSSSEEMLKNTTKEVTQGSQQVGQLGEIYEQYFQEEENCQEGKNQSDIQGYEQGKQEEQQQTQNTLKIRKIFAEAIINNPIFDKIQVYQQLRQLQLPYPKTDNEYYEMRLSFIYSLVKYLDNLIPKDSPSSIKLLHHSSMNCLVTFVINCKQMLLQMHSAIIIKLLKLQYEIQPQEITEQELVSLHKILGEIVQKSQSKQKPKGQYVGPFKLSQRRKEISNTAKPYVSNVQQINSIWNKDHSSYLYQLYSNKVKPNQMQLQFSLRFPQYGHIWTKYGLIQQWYKMSRQAYNAFKQRLVRDDFSYMGTPKSSTVFTNFLITNISNLEIQLRLLQMMEERVNHQFVQDTIIKINKAWIIFDAQNSLRRKQMEAKKQKMSKDIQKYLDILQ